MVHYIFASQALLQLSRMTVILHTWKSPKVRTAAMILFPLSPGDSAYKALWQIPTALSSIHCWEIKKKTTFFRAHYERRRSISDYHLISSFVCGASNENSLEHTLTLQIIMRYLNSEITMLNVVWASAHARMAENKAPKFCVADERIYLLLHRP